MKKTILTFALATFTSSYAVAAQNPNIENYQQYTCKVGGCDLLCTASNGAVVKKAEDIRTATEVNFKSGTTKYELTFAFNKGIVTVPAGTVACILTKVDTVQ